MPQTPLRLIQSPASVGQSPPVSLKPKVWLVKSICGRLELHLKKKNLIQPSVPCLVHNFCWFNPNFSVINSFISQCFDDQIVQICGFWIFFGDENPIFPSKSPTFPGAEARDPPRGGRSQRGEGQRGPKRCATQKILRDGSCHDGTIECVHGVCMCIYMYI